MRSPIDAFVAGKLDEDQLVSEVDRVLATGDSEEKATLLVSFETHGNSLPLDTLHKIKKKVELQHASGAVRRSANTGDILNRRFVLKERLGSGGMGTVFKALDLRRQEAEDRSPYVALKLIKAEAIDQPEAVKILQREARKTQYLAHPNVVMVYDYDRDGDLSYITMELLDGETLDKVLARMRNKPLPIARCGEIIEQIASALDAAHAIGLVHLDLKPANIFIERNGRVKVIDFGISRILPKRNSADATVFDIRKLGALTPAYASIEMLLGEDVDARDDVFGFACIAYEIISGKHPFNGKPATVALAKNLKPIRPSGLTDQQWKALQSGLDLDKSRRTITAKQIAASLSNRGFYNRNKYSGRISSSFSARTRSPRLWLGGLGAALIAVVLFGIVSARSDSHFWQLLPFNAGTTGPSAEQQQAEAAARAAAARKAAEAAQQADAAREAAEAAQRADAARKAAEAAQQADDARRAAEAAQQADDARKAATAAQRTDATRKAAAAAQRADAARKAAAAAQPPADAARKVQDALKRARDAMRARPLDEEHPRAEDLDRLEQGNGEESARLRQEEDARIQQEVEQQEARNREAIRARQEAARARDAGRAQDAASGPAAPQQ